MIVAPSATVPGGGIPEVLIRLCAELRSGASDDHGLHDDVVDPR